MFITASGVRCRAKNPASCRFHGAPPGSRINFTDNRINDYPDTEKQRMFQISETFKMLLTREEEEAVKYYVEHGYTSLGRQLMTSEELNDKHKQVVELLDSALRKAYLPEPTIVYRGTTLWDNSGEKLKVQSVEEAIECVEAEYPVGRIISFDKFTSSTTDPNCLSDFFSQSWDVFSDDYKKRNPRDKYDAIFPSVPGVTNVMFEFQTSKGASVTSFGQTYAEKEQEILLPRGGKYRVVGVIPFQRLTFKNKTRYETTDTDRMVHIVRLEEV